MAHSPLCSDFVFVLVTNVLKKNALFLLIRPREPKKKGQGSKKGCSHFLFGDITALLCHGWGGLGPHHTVCVTRSVVM